MPQLDTTWFSSQIFWFLLFFAILFSYFTFSYARKLRYIIHKRKRKYKAYRENIEYLNFKIEATMHEIDLLQRSINSEFQHIVSRVEEEIRSESLARIEEINNNFAVKLRALEETAQAEKAVIMQDIKNSQGEIIDLVVAKCVEFVK